MVTIIKKDNKIQKSNNYKALCLLFAGIAGYSVAVPPADEEADQQVELAKDEKKGGKKGNDEKKGGKKGNDEKKGGKKGNDEKKGGKKGNDEKKGGRKGNEGAEDACGDEENSQYGLKTGAACCFVGCWLANALTSYCGAKKLGMLFGNFTPQP